MAVAPPIHRIIQEPPPFLSATERHTMIVHSPSPTTKRINEFKKQLPRKKVKSAKRKLELRKKSGDRWLAKQDISEEEQEDS